MANIQWETDLENDKVVFNETCDVNQISCEESALNSLKPLASDVGDVAKNEEENSVKYDKIDENTECLSNKCTESKTFDVNQISCEESVQNSLKPLASDVENVAKTEENSVKYDKNDENTECLSNKCIESKTFDVNQISCEESVPNSLKPLVVDVEDAAKNEEENSVKHDKIDENTQCLSNECTEKSSEGNGDTASLNNAVVLSKLLDNDTKCLPENTHEDIKIFSQIIENRNAVKILEANVTNSFINVSTDNNDPKLESNLCETNQSDECLNIELSIEKKGGENVPLPVSYIIDLEKKNSDLEQEMLLLKSELNAKENEISSFKQLEVQSRAEYLGNIEKLSKDCNTLRKEKEAMVIKYAVSEREVINEKKTKNDIEKKLKELNKDRDNLLSKVKTLASENSRLSSTCENKILDISKLQKSLEKLYTDFNSKEVRIKWLQNKLKIEMEAHQETQGKYESALHKLNEMKEEAEQIRKDCQEMIKCYQEAEEIKSVKLDSQLRLKLSELEVQKQEKCDQEHVYQLLKHELDALKKKQRGAMEENNSLTLKINYLEKERLEYEQNLSKQKDSQNILKQEVVDLTARIAEMETLRLQLEREKEKSAASLREVERLRSTNAELQADMNSCHMKEGELLKFTEGVTDTNVKLQSAHSLLEVKAQAFEDELNLTKTFFVELEQKHLQLTATLESNTLKHDEEIQLLAKKLAEKAKSVEKLNTKLDESENENRVLKRRHIASIKELSRELYECKKKLDVYDSNTSIRGESSSLGSRSSSTASLDAANSNYKTGAQSQSTKTLSNEQSPNNHQSTSSDFPEIDKEMLIERIIKLQKTLARKNDKIDFLEDHIVQLVQEMRKKTKNVDLKNV